MRARWASAALAVAVACGVVGCGSSSSNSGGSADGSSTNASSGTIVIGATIPLTGAFAAFGQQEKIGDNLAVDQVNASGGITINGQKRKVVVDYIDSQSQPNLTTTQARTLVLQNHAVGFFGTIAPPLVIPLSQVADQLHVPFVHHTPIQAWLGVTAAAGSTPGTSSSTSRR
jgi:branched-chain amino acid transport system substrate-binding protein